MNKFNIYLAWCHIEISTYCTNITLLTINMIYFSYTIYVATKNILTLTVNHKAKVRHIYTFIYKKSHGMRFTSIFSVVL